jgi:hypothetical protein
LDKRMGKGAGDVAMPDQTMLTAVRGNGSTAVPANPGRCETSGDVLRGSDRQFDERRSAGRQAILDLVTGADAAVSPVTWG